MIYLDTSVALAHVFNEPQAPSADFWGKPLVSSELLEYELKVRANARGLSLEPIDDLLSRIALLPLERAVLTRAFQSFPTTVRTLDAIHLAAADYLRAQRQPIELATFDTRLATAARAIGLTTLQTFQ